MQLVASPALDDLDIEALRVGHEEPTTVCRRVVARSLREVETLLEREHLNSLAWLVARGSLEVRLAIRIDASGRPARGIYHEKIGIFTDAEGNHVAFTGSANETAGGLVENYESIDVYWSWDDPHGRVADKIEAFEALWENRAPGVRVYEFTEISRELLERYRLPTPPSVHESPAPSRALLLAKEPRPYQVEAIDAWFARGCKGILAMATGAGKTLTALHAINRLAEGKRLAVIIACPYVNLAEQWVRELQAAGIAQPIKCYGSQAQWRKILESGMTALRFGSRTFLPIVVVNRTFLTREFQAALCPDQVPHLLVADEMHNLGADHLRASLDPRIKFRLGLSATPERHLDEGGTRALFHYFGDVVYTYDLARAIREGTLCSYLYHPVLVELTQDESDLYLDLSNKIGRLMASQSSDDPPSLPLQALLIRRARLLAAAEGKLPALTRVIQELRAAGKAVSRALVYCGDGQVDAPDGDDAMIRQVDAAVHLLGQGHRLRVTRFTHAEALAERERSLVDLRNDRLDALVAIRCLDEGIDLPDVRMGFILASSTNPRQFIQRRGRLLRRAEGKDRAEIWDFIVSPPPLDNLVEDSVFNMERRMVKRELERVEEFCDTALNGDAAKGVLLDLRRRYNLLA